jgi:PAS domain S-box-containing protein
VSGLALPAVGAQRRNWLGLAAILFVAIFALRAGHADHNALVSLLYVIPIALIAVERGMIWGLAAATLAVCLFGAWDVAGNQGHDVWHYLPPGAAFFLFGGLVGGLADRVRRITEHSRRFWDLSTDMLCTAGFDGYFKRLNDAWVHALGWSVEELCARPFLDFVHPEDVELTRRESNSLSGGDYETVTFENRYRCKDGSYRTLLWSARTAPGQTTIYATARDVTQSKRAQDELRHSERFLDSVLENLPNMVFVKDAQELRFVRLNRAGEELLGVPRMQLLGTAGYEMFSGYSGSAVVQDDRDVLAGGKVADFPEESIETPNGPRIVHTRKIAIRDDDGEPLWLVGISEDVTDQRLAERAALAATAEAERANQAKSEFLSRMSHELRTPLNAVIGFGQLLQLDRLDAGQAEAADQIVMAGRHLLQLIDEVLDISRIESGTMSLVLEAVDLEAVVDDALALIRPLAAEAGVELVGRGSGFAGLHVLADRQRLKQVLINLLSNAVKYNRSGGEVHVDCIEQEHYRVEIAVTDTGRGIDAEQLQRLFHPFDRLGAEGSGVQGTGLGLSLCKGLVEAMGGSIAGESRPQAGTTMRVVLYAAQDPGTPGPDPPQTTPDQQPARADRTIVYVEDDLSNLRLVERLVARLPHVRLIPAVQGKLAMELTRHHRPDLILLDLHLPDVPGREVLAQLKSDPATAAVPIVVLSADIDADGFAQLRDLGAAGYLTKPSDIGALLDVIRDGVDRLPTAEQMARALDE